MDVAKYIGLFLLKNNFVYIHGLGNLEIRKRPASYNGESLQGPSYEVAMTPMGSIDDNLANFIATNEQISISKASNALREFSTQARADLQAGKPVSLPAVGTFVEEKGKTTFVTDPNFQYTPPSIASIKVARRQDETVYTTNADIPAVKPRYIDPDTDHEGPTGISWVKIGLWAVGLIVLGLLAYFGVQYMNSQDSTKEAPLIQTPVHDTVAHTAVTPGTTDSTAVDSVEAPAQAPAPGGTINMDVILNTYTDMAKAQRRLDKLTSFGNKVELVVEEDSSAIYVVLPMAKVSTADTAKILDSLKRVFNPTYGVRILK